MKKTFKINNNRGLNMYNKEISEKMLEDVIEMYDNISKIKKVCGEIVGRNVVTMIDNDEESDERRHDRY